MPDDRILEEPWHGFNLKPLECENMVHDVFLDSQSESDILYEKLLQLCQSIDTIVDGNETVKLLNSLDILGMPPHNLRLKIGSLVILLRNLNPPKLCNGTWHTENDSRNGTYLSEGRTGDGGYPGQRFSLWRVGAV
ncbi:hypothetical protein TNCV_2909211 [Trichonephila clavipes]|nr:hypothetical protein TNCV_2909211 [Trichonephila clavipes]